ncbi:hypothetical protein [Paraburkholderia sp. UCT2]|uniref:hypothetical protein n=1 Tax=Paraburkholderia sp. UCT2 TaxID=2615208 RepID=UPI00223AB0A7|nr:hypothetical protein [Paraburkholderia sp. UCT2]
MSNGGFSCDICIRFIHWLRRVGDTPQGGLVKELKDPNLLDAPWDLTVIDGGRFVRVFVADVLNGKVARIDLAIGEDGVQVLPGSTNTATVWTLRTDSQ